MTMRIIVCGTFAAFHRCCEIDLHQHTWHVTAWFRAPGRVDARTYRDALDTLLAGWDGQVLPSGSDWNEDIAEAVAALPDCDEVRVWREADRLGVHLHLAR